MTVDKDHLQFPVFVLQRNLHKYMKSKTLISWNWDESTVILRLKNGKTQKSSPNTNYQSVTLLSISIINRKSQTVQNQFIVEFTPWDFFLLLHFDVKKILKKSKISTKAKKKSHKQLNKIPH